ncbi:protein kinase [Gordonia terrae]
MLLSDATVAENIAFARPDATAAEIAEAARRADAHDFISRLPDGYDTRIGQRGRTLSGGQRQRLNVARGLLRGGGLLILDEPTTGLDRTSRPAGVRQADRHLGRLRHRTSHTVHPQGHPQASVSRRGGRGVRPSRGTRARRSRSPHLVRGYGMLPPDKSSLVGFTMQTIPGATLDAAIENGPLSTHDVLQLGVQLSAALHHLHSHNWIHLDVKPSNVIIHGGQAILIDLGILGRPGERRDGSGTRGYLPPEQAVGVALGPAADVFALGVTLFEVLTSRRPYGAIPPWSERGIGRLRTRGRPTSIRPMSPGVGARGHVPDELVELLGHMLDLDPDRRPEMGAVWQRLAWMTEGPVRR